MSGFAWNSTTQLIEAEKEVWDAMIKEKPEAAKWKTKKVYQYDNMIELFSKDRATGDASGTANDKMKEWNEEADIDIHSIDDVDELISKNQVHLENYDTADDIEVLPSMPQSATKYRNRKRKHQDEEPTTTKIMSSIQNVADAIDRGNTIFERSQQRVYTESEIFNELKLMGLVSTDLRRAYLYLVDNQQKARALFGCPIEERLDMLEVLMNASRP